MTALLQSGGVFGFAALRIIERQKVILQQAFVRLCVISPPSCFVHD
jgi:hypothetical protein